VGLRAWFRSLRRRKPRYEPSPGEPPFEEAALVPRRPGPNRGSDAVALQEPEEPDDVDARGREA
jgi:hypothetical protein